MDKYKIGFWGCPQKGKLIIKTLEELGGKNTHSALGTYDSLIYFIKKVDNSIGTVGLKELDPEIKVYHIDEFLKEKDEPRSTNMDENHLEKRIEYDLPEGYELDKIENGKIYLKPTSKYPKTYEEVCKVLGIEKVTLIPYLQESGLSLHRSNLFDNINMLLNIKDAYWKIYIESGEETQEDKVVKFVISETLLTINFPEEEAKKEFVKNFSRLLENLK